MRSFGRIIVHIVCSLLTVIFILIFEHISSHKIDRLLNTFLTININKHFCKTILGDIAFKRSEDGDCLYVVQYYKDVDDTGSGNYELVSLAHTVDIATWRQEESNSIVVNIFSDSEHIYEEFDSEYKYIICYHK